MENKYPEGVELPPSGALQKAHSDGSTDAGVLSVECTLPVEEVNIWLDHLTSVAANRKRGKAKAAETRSSKKDHPRTILPELCRKFYSLGWMYGTGGALSVRTGDKIYITPSGLPKELVQGDELFVQTIDGTDIDLPPTEKKLKKSTCTPLIGTVYRLSEGCNAVYHLHNSAAVMVSMLWSGTEFRITHQKMIQCIKKGNSDRHFDYYDTLVVPIIENKSTEDEIAESMSAAMLDYPETSGILIRRHGMYVWGPSWQKAKNMAESFDYLFNIAMKMKQFGLDPEEVPVAPDGAYT